MSIREKIIAGDMPSKLIAELRDGGATWQEATREFVLAFPETGTEILDSVRKLGLGMYSAEQDSLNILDYLILRRIRDAGLFISVPPEPH